MIAAGLALAFSATMRYGDVQVSRALDAFMRVPRRNCICELTRQSRSGLLEHWLLYGKHPAKPAQPYGVVTRTEVFPWLWEAALGIPSPGKIEIKLLKHFFGYFAT